MFFSAIEDIKNDLLFIHAWTGCDTTSAIFYKGKGSLVATLRKSQRMREMPDIISNVWSSQNEVGEASIEAFKILYGGKRILLYPGSGLILISTSNCMISTAIEKINLTSGKLRSVLSLYAREIMRLLVNHQIFSQHKVFIVTLKLTLLGKIPTCCLIWAMDWFLYLTSK